MTGLTSAVRRSAAMLAVLLLAALSLTGSAAGQEAEEDERHDCVVADTATADTDTDTIWVCEGGAMPTSAGGGGWAAAGGGDLGAVPTRIDAGVGGAFLAQVDDCSGGGGVSSGSTADESTADTETAEPDVGDAGFSATSHDGDEVHTDTPTGEECAYLEAGAGAGAGGLGAVPTRIDAGAGGAAAATTATPAALTGLAAVAGAVAMFLRRRH